MLSGRPDKRSNVLGKIFWGSPARPQFQQRLLWDVNFVSLCHAKLKLTRLMTSAREGGVEVSHNLAIVSLAAIKIWWIVVRNGKGMSSSPKSKTARSGVKFSCRPGISSIKVGNLSPKGSHSRASPPHMQQSASKSACPPAGFRGGGGHMRYSGWG